MGELESIRRLLSDVKLSDSAVDRIMNPSPQELSSRKIDDPTTIKESWRYTSRVGLVLDPRSGYKLRANFFRLNTSNIAPVIFHYHVDIRNLNKQGEMQDDITSEKNYAKLCLCVLLQYFQDLGKSVFDGISYDGTHTVFSAFPLRPGDDTQEGAGDLDENEVTSDDTAFVDVKYLNAIYKVKFLLVSQIYTNRGIGKSLISSQYHNFVLTLVYYVDENLLPVLRSLDTSLLSFARWQSAEDNPKWFSHGTKAFLADGPTITLTKPYVAVEGYSASLRICKAGLMLISDLQYSVLVIQVIFEDVCFYFTLL